MDLSTGAVYSKAETSEKPQRDQTASANLLLDMYIQNAIYIEGHRRRRGATAAAMGPGGEGGGCVISWGGDTSDYIQSLNILYKDPTF